MFKKMSQIVSLCVLLASCSVMDASRLLDPTRPSYEMTAQVGKANSQEKNNIKLETNGKEYKQDAERISNDNNYTADSIKNITQGMSTLELIILIVLAGIAIPTTAQIYSGIKAVIGDIWKGLIIRPLKDIFSLFKRSENGKI